MSDKTEKFVVEITPQGCGSLFRDYGLPSTADWRLMKTPEKVSLVVFTGGHDVWPELYGENAGTWTYFSVQRDMYEGAMFEQALKHKIPMVGICRGSQFLCVKAGGKLCQDINNHGSNHKMRTSDDRVLVCNSSHHQMQLPPEGAIPLAWAEPKISVDRFSKQPHYLNGDDDQIEVDREYEVVYYPNINALGIQYHPEWLSEKEECVKYALEMTQKYLFPKKAEAGATAKMLGTAA